MCLKEVHPLYFIVNMKKYVLEVKGYLMEGNEKELPEESGIYIVYKCVQDRGEHTVGLIEILYIGQAENIRKRHVPRHERYNDFMRECEMDEDICYAWILVDQEDLDRVENGLIYMQQPVLCDRGR